MREHAVIVPTAAGPASAIVHEPEGGQRGAIVLLQGLGPAARAGVNAIWTRIARELAALGLVVLRFDFSCEGDSTLAGTDVERGFGWRRSTDLAMLRDLVPWFLERVGESELLLVGSCHGGRIALEFAAAGPLVRDLFLITPYLWRREPVSEDEPPDLEPVWANGPTLNSDGEIVAGFRAALSRGAVWVLVGEGEEEAANLRPFAQQLEQTGPSYEVEVVPEIAIHPVGHPRQQEAVRERLLRRVSLALAERGRLAAPAP